MTTFAADMAEHKYNVERYAAAMAGEWDALVDRARNATFLHRRGYMDYHSDRFQDASLMVKDEQDRVVALLPASVDGDTVTSHGGLTYGGLLLPVKGADAHNVLGMVEAILVYYRSAGCKRLIYKPVPHLYHRQPCEEDIYALWRHGARLDYVNMSSTIDLEHPLPFDMSNRRYVRLAERDDLQAGVDDDWDGYWQVLTERLDERHGATPVHSHDEMVMLHRRFPDNIRLYTMRNREGSLLGGIIVYLTDTCVHCQYMATTAEGRRSHVLPPLVATIMETEGKGRRWLDFGTCNEDRGRVLNTGLVEQKNGMGGRGTIYQSLIVDL